MNDDLKEYTVNDYSQIDKHLEQVNNREKAFTDRLRIKNFFNFSIAALIFCFAIGLLALLVAWSFRLMVYGPKETKIVEKLVEHPHTHNNQNNENSASRINNQAIKILQNANEENINNKNVLTDVIAFRSVNVNIKNFNQVNSRWKYIKGDDVKPIEQSCYADGEINNLNIKLELAYLDNNKVSSRYMYNEANKYGLTRNQWDSLVKECQWYQS